MTSLHSHTTQFEKPRYEIADVLRLYLKNYLKTHKLSRLQYKAVKDILACRSEYLGYHKLQCVECGYERIEYNSCRNRHCPKCQGSKRIVWVNERLKEILPVLYFHSVFTLPHMANYLALYNKEIVYDIFMKSCSQTINVFARDPKHLGAQTGYVGILHTWGQTLSHHIHAHFIIPAGGISPDGKRWINLPYRKDFLFPVKAMSQYMRKTFCAMLQKAYDDGRLRFEGAISQLRHKTNFKRFINKLAWCEWVNYSKKPFATSETIVKYIGRYTHRVAISNHRILSIANGRVTFRYKEYKDGQITPKIMTLKSDEFIRRFLLHIIPKGFKKIRYFGFLSSGLRTKSLETIRRLLDVVVETGVKIERTYNSILDDLLRCPDCGTGRMQLIETYSSRDP